MNEELLKIQQDLNTFMDKLDEPLTSEKDFNNILQSLNLLINRISHFSLEQKPITRLIKKLLSTLRDLNKELVVSQSHLKSLDLAKGLSFYLDNVLTLNLQRATSKFNIGIITHLCLEFKNSIAKKYKYVADIFEKMYTELNEAADTYLNENIAISYENNTTHKEIADFDWFSKKCAEIITKNLDTDEVKEAFNKDEHPIFRSIIKSIVTFLHFIKCSSLSERLENWFVEKSEQEKSARQNFVTLFKNKNSTATDSTDVDKITPTPKESL